MAVLARVVTILSLLITASSSVSGDTPRTLGIVDNKPIDAPGDVAAVPTRDLLIAMAFNRGEAITSRVGSNGVLSEIARSPVGPEPRAMTFVFGDALLILANSIANELGVFEVGEDGRLREINRASSGGVNPYDVTAAFDEVVVVANRDSNQIATFAVNREGRLTLVDRAPTGMFPHVVAVSRRDGLVAVANQTDRTISLFELGPTGRLTPRRTVTLDNMTPRTLIWGNDRRLYVALDAPTPSEDIIRTLEMLDNGEVEHRGDTPAGYFLTDLEATSEALFAVTVNINGPGGADDRDEVRVYRFQGHELVTDVAVQTPGTPPSFKQIAVGGRHPGARHVVTTEFQGGWLRSLFYFSDEEPGVLPSARRVMRFDP